MNIMTQDSGSVEIFYPSGCSTLVDIEDLPLAMQRFRKQPQWGYIHNRQGGLHRQILNAPKGLWVDHKNGNTADNRRSNIRLCTPAENLRNRPPMKASIVKKHGSKYKGLAWDYTGNYQKRWMAKICVDGKTHWLGCYATEEEAAKAYDKGALKYHGEFAKLNFPL